MTTQSISSSMRQAQPKRVKTTPKPPARASHHPRWLWVPALITILVSLAAIVWLALKLSDIRPVELSSNARPPETIDGDRARAQHEAGNEAWNQLCSRIEVASPESYPELLKQAKRFPLGPAQRRTIESLEAMIRQRGGQLFGFYQSQAAELASIGQYGDAIRLLGWFPVSIDPSREGELRRETDNLRRLANETSTNAFIEFEHHLYCKNFDEARRALIKVARVGVDELALPLEAKFAQLAKAEEAATSEANAAVLSACKEQGPRLRALFLSLIQSRRFELARALAFEKSDGDLVEVSQMIERMFSRIEAKLGTQSGMLVLLDFGRSVLQGKLKSARSGKVRVNGAVEELRLLQNLREYVRTSADRGLVALLEGRLASALEDLYDVPGAVRMIEEAGQAAAPIVGAIEKTFAERLSQNDLAGALQELGRLELVPQERPTILRDRIQCLCRDQRYAEALSDLEQLFAMKIVDRHSVDWLIEVGKHLRVPERLGRLCDDALRVFSKEPELYLLMAEQHLAAGEFDKLNALLAAAPEDARIRHLKTITESAQRPIDKSCRYTMGRYEVETDADLQTAIQVARFLDSLEHEYVKSIPHASIDAVRFRVRVFASSASYDRYCEPYGADRCSTAARYLNATKELVTFVGADMLAALRHEGFHQFADVALRDCPRWLIEGFACFFETGTVTAPKTNPLLASQLRKRDALDLKALLLSETEPQDMRAAAWSLIYYLHRSRRRDILDRYLAELTAGKSQERAFSNVFERENFKALQVAWRVAVFDDRYDD